MALLGAVAALVLPLHVPGRFASRTGHGDAGRLLMARTGITPETREALRLANASSAAPCTPEDIALLRRLAFQSRTIKDVGRLHEGKLVCSGTLGVLGVPYVYPEQPDLTIEGRYRVYTSLDLLIAPGHTAVIVCDGNANVVLDPLEHGNAAAFGPLAGTTLATTPRGDIPASASAATQAGGTGALLDALVGGGIGGSLGIAAVVLRRRAQALPRRLRVALEAGRIELLYQPVIDAGRGRTVGAEALLRLTLDGRPMDPEAVADAAIRHGLSLHLLRAILRTAARDVGPLLRERPHFRLSLNVTAADIADPRLPDALRVLLDQCASPDQIMLELTERQAPDPAVAAPAIERLRALGVRVALDDFGMGYSNIAVVTALRVDVVKLDRSFTEAIGTGSPREAVMPELIALAAKLHLAMVAEGVETESQARFLAERGVPWHQGWLYGRPMTMPQLAERLAREASAPARQPAAPA